jgi:nucleoside-diphosphate-sugar epimerase
MSGRKILIAGARGMVGRAAFEHFERRGWEVLGLSRSPADFDTSAPFLNVDLRDAASTASALSGLSDVTHLVFSALYEQPQLAAGWTSPEHIEINTAMLRNLMEPLERSNGGLEHVTLLQGTKAYGGHLSGAMRVPAKEDRPRVEHPNFYFAQEDWLRARQDAGARFALSILRPQVVCGVAVGAPMNVVSSVGAFASLRREQGLPLVHPGHPDSVTELVDAALIAEMLEWVATTPRCRGETYNVANGDVVMWSDLFLSIADHYGMELAPHEAISMCTEMPRQEGLWVKLMARDGLRYSLPDLIGASWQYADILWANSRSAPRPSLVSTLKAREHGFQGFRDSESMFIEQLDQMERESLLPRCR